MTALTVIQRWNHISWTEIFSNAPSLTITFPLCSLTDMFPTKKQTLHYIIVIVHPLQAYFKKCTGFGWGRVTVSSMVLWSGFAVMTEFSTERWFYFWAGLAQSQGFSCNSTHEFSF